MNPNHPSAKGRWVVYTATMRLLTATLLLILGACQAREEHSLPYFNSAEFTPEWNATSSLTGQLHTIPSFRLVDQRADTITETILNGKITVVDFFFTLCPGICPRLTASMERIQEAYRTDNSVQMLSYSVTPHLDSVQRLREYAEQHHVLDTKWHLLTGDRKDIYTLARQGYFADEVTGLQKSENEFLHTENFLLIDGQRRIRGIYSGTNREEIERLIEDIRILQIEMKSHAS